MIEGKKLSIRFGDVMAANQLDFTVPTGEIYGLIGVNGAGKTSLLKMLSGIYKPDSGECLYDGSPIYDNPKIIQNVAFVADGNNYISTYTVQAMLRYYETMFPGFDRKSFAIWNEAFQVPMSPGVSTLSHGQKVRLQFMLSLARHPKYLLLDESIANLDPLAKDTLLELLVAEVEERGMTVLFSSHQIQVLESICDGVFFMRDGSFFLQGNVAKIKEENVKISFIREEPPAEFADWEKTISYKNVGNMYTGIFAASAQEAMKKLCDAGAREVKIEDISLQELFVALSREHK